MAGDQMTADNLIPPTIVSIYQNYHERSAARLPYLYSIQTQEAQNWESHKYSAPSPFLFPSRLNAEYRNDISAFWQLGESFPTDQMVLLGSATAPAEQKYPNIEGRSTISGG